MLSPFEACRVTAYAFAAATSASCPRQSAARRATTGSCGARAKCEKDRRCPRVCALWKKGSRKKEVHIHTRRCEGAARVASRLQRPLRRGLLRRESQVRESVKKWRHRVAGQLESQFESAAERPVPTSRCCVFQSVRASSGVFSKSLSSASPRARLRRAGAVAGSRARRAARARHLRRGSATRGQSQSAARKGTQRVCLITLCGDLLV